MQTTILRTCTLLLITLTLAMSSGCGTLFRERAQSVRIVTNPPGGEIYYRERMVADGEQVKIRRRFTTPELNVGTRRDPVMQNVEYDYSKALIGDGLLFFPFFIPGIIAFTTDIATGAWRDIKDPQHVVTSGRRVRVESEKGLPATNRLENY